MLVAARLRHIASTKWGKRRYLVMETLLNPAKQESVAENRIDDHRLTSVASLMVWFVVLGSSIEPDRGHRLEM